jgi:hypothetical protein
MRIIAQASPTLITHKSHNYLENELELSDIISKGLSTNDMAQFRALLVKSLPAKYKEVVASERRISFLQCIYLLSVLVLEKMRAIGVDAQGSGVGLEMMLVYTDASAGEMGDMAVCMEGVMHKVMDGFVEALEANEDAHRRDAVLQEQVVCVCVCVCTMQSM